jgi:hypothetical protein
MREILVQPVLFLSIWENIISKVVYKKLTNFKNYK